MIKMTFLLSVFLLIQINSNANDYVKNGEDIVFQIGGLANDKESYMSWGSIATLVSEPKVTCYVSGKVEDENSVYVKFEYYYGFGKKMKFKIKSIKLMSNEQLITEYENDYIFEINTTAQKGNNEQILSFNLPANFYNMSYLKQAGSSLILEGVSWEVISSTK